MGQGADEVRRPASTSTRALCTDQTILTKAGTVPRLRGCAWCWQRGRFREISAVPTTLPRPLGEKKLHINLFISLECERSGWSKCVGTYSRSCLTSIGETVTGILSSTATKGRRWGSARLVFCCFLCPARPSRFQGPEVSVHVRLFLPFLPCHVPTT